MFRFWSSDSRGSDKTGEGEAPPDPVVLDGFLTSTSPAPARPPKRRRPSLVDTTAHLACTDRFPVAKRAKHELNGQLPSPTSASADGEEDDEDDAMLSRESHIAVDAGHARDTIQYQFGLEILLKHDELRLINQELAKCQVALEQLRRCHLIPYPVHCPTPEQMLDISSGKGAALQARPGHQVPKWAPPFGVVEGPYARHYAKWLIPDPKFDGVTPVFLGPADSHRARSAVAEGRTTRNSFTDAGGVGKRPARGGAGQKLQALSSGYPQPKDKQSPCVVRRADGQTVKLICIDCHRWDFSSTQGFINHCRIAHRRDFKSHEEAAVHCGHPIDGDDVGATGGDDKTSAVSAPGLVHPFARSEPITDQQAYVSLLSRIHESVSLFREGKLPNVKSIPGAATSRTPKPEARSSGSFVGSSETPFLSRLMQKKKFKGNLSEQVDDAKTKMDFDELLSPGDDSEDADHLGGSASPKKLSTAAVRTPVVMRVPARTAVSPAVGPSAHSTAAKSRVPSQLGLMHMTSMSSQEVSEREDMQTPMYEDDMDVDLSPNTMASNNAPSLVSDDGEYDESDDGSSSETSESMDAESVSDVAEIDIDENNEIQDHNTPGPIRHHQRSTTTAVKLKKEESKHVTFVSPMTNNPKGRRKQRL